MKKIIAICAVAVMLITATILILVNTNNDDYYRGSENYIYRDGERITQSDDAETLQEASRVFDPVEARWLADTVTMPPISTILYGQTPRNGYILAPSMFGLTGIDPQSQFVLQAPSNYDSLPSISIDGQPEPKITREDNRTFIITPAVPLTSNSVYIFRLSRGDNSDEADITWAFQTTVRFEISSSLPRNQSANVPVRTGIEIAFSHGNEINIQDHFSIYPHVAGRFIYRDSTTIFMPTEPLAYGQIYTVVISAGIRLPGTTEIIETDYRFSFETAPTRQQLVQRPASNIRFPNRHVEFPSFANPEITFRLNYSRDHGRPRISFDIYRIDSRAQAIDATNRLISAPNWSQLSHDGRFMDTSNLTRVYSETIARRRDESGWHETFTLSENLAPGFYVVNATTDDSQNQMILQITDLAVQIVADNNRVLVWVNDMTTGLPVAGASVYDPITGRTVAASRQGIAVVERMLSTGEYLIVTTSDGKQVVVFAHSSAFQSFRGGWDWGWDWGWDDCCCWGWGGSSRSRSTSNNNYWTALQLDRTLFQRDDTVSLWGFVQNRRQDENITHVTAILRQRSWGDTLHTQNIPVSDGAYSGEIRLPNLDPGSYELAIFHGSIRLDSIFFTVKDYVTPPYQLTVTPSINAIFAGEEVTFSARTAFFEGTPVPDLDISYGFQGRDLRIPPSGRSDTDIEGLVELTARPTVANSEAQSERSLRFSAEATLPEIGWVHQAASVRVFINDISVRPGAMRTGADATLTVNVNDITLERINDGSAAHRGDFLCEPTANQRISVEITEVYWQRIRDGERYDHVTRQVVAWYRHERRERVVERFEMTTNADGEATREFSVPDREHASYIARLTTTDGNGRTIEHRVFIGRDFTSFFRNAGDDRLFLYGADSDGYDIGDSVELTIMRGTEPVTQGNFLFVVVQDGILSYHVGTNPLLFTFDEKHVPNAQVFAFHFNGHTYNSGWHMSQRLRFNPQERQLNINITTCLDAYRPGDMATITVQTTDLSGNPIAANVNVSLVDEALFALMDYNVDTLDMLYRNVSDSLRFSMATHRTFISDGIDDEEDVMAESEAASSAPAAAPSPDSGGGDDTHVRERFEDTAVFKSLRTNAGGEATFTFRLPDNITSWRVTSSAISDDLYAGNAVQNLRVTQPMFLHYTLGSVFLVGDRPYIGVNAYGTSLSGGERVTFEVWSDENPEDIRRATGASFARVNIPMWEKTAEGAGSITIRATVLSYNDAVRHTYTVVRSHRQVDSAMFYDVTQNTVFDVNPGGLTNITFTDHGRGQFLRDLFSIRNAWWSTGARIEGFVARREATRLINQHFPDVTTFGDAGNFDALEYQTQSGGIAILPYADADLYTTVMLMPFIMDDVNTVALRSYLRNVFDSQSANNKVLALYGLAMLGEPVLLELHRYAELDGLSVRNSAYIALGFAALGEMQMAEEIFNARIAPHMQAVAPYYRINVGANRAEILEVTSISALLAARLGMPESIGLHSYAVRHRFDASSREDMLLMSIERLNFISFEIENHTNVTASITYTLFGETITSDLSRGRQFTLRIPAQNMHEFNITAITGEVGAVSIVRTPLEDMEIIENDIVIRREFFRADTNTSTNTFEQGDLVRVQITVDYSPRSLSGSYVITDFLPAGLVHVPRSARFGDRASTPGRQAWVRTEGQRITFFDFNGRFEHGHTYFYYARVISPGTFTAEGTFVQSVGARQYMAVGNNAVLTVNP